MKWLLRTLFTFTCIFSLLTLFKFPVSAALAYLDDYEYNMRTYCPNTAAGASAIHYKLNGGVGNSGYNTRYYWVDSSASSLSTMISLAIGSWNTTPFSFTTKIWFQNTSSKSSSVMDIYVKPNPYGTSSNISAEVKIYASSGSSSTPFPTASVTSNYVWGMINIFSPTFSSTLSDFNQRGTICHEMGHVLGLFDISHRDGNTSIMDQLGSGRSVNKPNENDYRVINHVYP